MARYYYSTPEEQKQAIKLINFGDDMVYDPEVKMDSGVRYQLKELKAELAEAKIKMDQVHSMCMDAIEEVNRLQEQGKIKREKQQKKK